MVDKYKNITFVVHPTQYNDFDILAIGDCLILKTLVKKEKHFYFIPKSKFGGIPIVVLDTCDTWADAKACIKQYRKLYGMPQTDKNL